MHHDLAHLCPQVAHVACEAGAFIRQELGRVPAAAVEDKALNSLVSYVDREAEALLVHHLSGLLPEATFLTEEATVAPAEGAWRWIIDPLDGTTNFLHQLPCFAVSVALQHHGATVLGVVYEVNRDECFTAWRGGGAYLNGQPIRCSSRTELASTLLATGFPYYDFSRFEAYLAAFSELATRTRGIRRWGAAAVDLAWTACGRFDGFFEYGLQPWDAAAGALLVQEAGGLVSDFGGGHNYLFGGQLVAAGAGVHPLLLEVVGAHLASQ